MMVRSGTTSGVALILLLALALLAACGTPSAPDAPPEATAAAAVPAGGSDSAGESAPESAASGEAAETAPGEARTFVIDPARSEARFMIDELLMGNPKTVVGSTNLVAGEVRVDLADYRVTEIGPVQIDARDLETDDNFRNRAMRRQILASDQDAYQYITFTPGAIEGLPAEVVMGEPFELAVTGDLQIRESVQPVTFAVTVTPVSEVELQGSARATVQRASFDLRIPNVPSVANVSEDVFLEFDFVAVAE